MTLTLRQWMKLVVACALAVAYVLPFVRLAEAGIAPWSTMLFVSAIGIPLVLALATIVLARERGFRDRLVRALCLTSVGIVLAAGIRELVTAVGICIRNGGAASHRALATMAVLGLFVLVLGVSFTLLAKGVLTPRSRKGGEARTG